MTRYCVSAVICATLFLAVLPQGANAQEATTTGGGSSLKDPPMPRGNVRGGALAKRAPGLRVKDGIARHVDKNKKAFFDFGGAKISQTDEEANAGLKEAFIEAFAKSFVEALNKFAESIRQSLVTQASLNKQIASGS